jgi:tRNA-modifying protein YgfZ
MTTNNTPADITSQGLLKISGDDAKKLLQGQLTCDLEQITAEASFGAHCNPQGRVISFFRIFKVSPDYYLQMPRCLIPIALKALQKYAIFYKAILSDVSVNYPDLLKPVEKEHDIKANIPAIYPETSGKFLPHDLNLHELKDTISFEKGCYTGQEIIARMQHLGKIKRHLYRITLQGNSPPVRGDDLDHQQGQVVDYCQIDYNTFEVLVIK